MIIFETIAIFLGAFFTKRNAIILAVLLAILVVDYWRRGSKSWTSRLARNVATNFFTYFINMLFGPVFIALSFYAETGYEALGIPQLDTSFWQTVPYWALCLFVVLAHDFCDYWNHRFMHNIRWLWPIHAIHHSDTDVTASTTFRVHFLEPLVMKVSYIVILTWISIPSGVLGAGAVFIVLHNMYVHINIDWHHGPFRYLLASPRYHRWHHADTPDAYGKNLANIFPFYDVIFGTYYVPGRCDVPMGVQGVPDTDAIKLALFPFVSWYKMTRRRWRKYSARLLQWRRDPVA